MSESSRRVSLLGETVAEFWLPEGCTAYLAGPFSARDEDGCARFSLTIRAKAQSEAVAHDLLGVSAERIKAALA